MESLLSFLSITISPAACAENVKLSFRFHFPVFIIFFTISRKFPDKKVKIREYQQND